MPTPIEQALINAALKADAHPSEWREWCSELRVAVVAYNAEQKAGSQYLPDPTPLLPSPAMTQFYRDVKGLGSVAVSRHAQERMVAAGISTEAFEQVLFAPTRPDVKEAENIVWRERNGIRIVILTNPTPNLGAVLVKTVFKVQPQATTRR